MSYSITMYVDGDRWLSILLEDLPVWWDEDLVRPNEFTRNGVVYRSFDYALGIDVPAARWYLLNELLGERPYLEAVSRASLCLQHKDAHASGAEVQPKVTLTDAEYDSFFGKLKELFFARV